MFYIAQWGHYQFSTFERVTESIHLSVRQMYACRWGPSVKEQASLLPWMAALSAVVSPFLLSLLRHRGSPEDQVRSVSSPAGSRRRWSSGESSNHQLLRVTEDRVRSKPTARSPSFIWVYHRLMSRCFWISQSLCLGDMLCQIWCTWSTKKAGG